ncbi:glycosyltransferase family 2 protein [Porticoccus sp. Uisw_050_02]|uniref:glycosyltransferase family 2 protein n=1 Tax=Porticoccus sp. Uisw_050_02 TaxID=3230978 RepID=UPI0039ECDE48|tara:strand:- start:10494 stop:11384 length:891 start_codon:yes stop_codon:yes gene_type:complete
MKNIPKAKPLTLKVQIPQLAEPEDISIVMAIYNHEATLADALDSALMQVMPYSSMIYCLNDASTDKSAEILNDYVQRYPDKIKAYTSRVNQGSGKKSFYHNKPDARGRYWCLLAGDDYWTTNDKLAKQIAFLDENTDFTGCSCNTVMRNETTKEESIIKPDRHTFNLLDLILLKQRYAFYVHTTSLVWRNVYLGHGFFLPPTFKNKYAHGDVVLMHMMLASGCKVHNIQEVMSCYRVTGRGVWTSKSEEHQAAANARLMDSIKKSIPFKYRMHIALQGLRHHSKVMRKFILGPVNE